MTSKLIDAFRDDVLDKISYKDTTDGGEVVKLAIYFVRDVARKLEGCICIDSDVGDFSSCPPPWPNSDHQTTATRWGKPLSSNSAMLKAA